MAGDRCASAPALFVMAVGAVAAESALVRVDVATTAALPSEHRHRPSVVVAAQALGVLVGTQQLDTGRVPVVEPEVGA
jgi:hypothetical protein